MYTWFFSSLSSLYPSHFASNVCYMIDSLAHVFCKCIVVIIDHNGKCVEDGLSWLAWLISFERSEGLSLLAWLISFERSEGLSLLAWLISFERSEATSHQPFCWLGAGFLAALCCCRRVATAKRAYNFCTVYILVAAALQCSRGTQGPGVITMGSALMQSMIFQLLSGFMQLTGPLHGSRATYQSSKVSVSCVSTAPELHEAVRSKRKRNRSLKALSPCKSCESPRRSLVFVIDLDCV